MGARTTLLLENISGLNSDPEDPPPDINTKPNISKQIEQIRIIYFFLLNKKFGSSFMIFLFVKINL